MMRCTPETDNRFDRWAVLVKMQDGRSVGRMPAEICRTIHQGLRSGATSSTECIFLGEMQHDGPVRGGGPKLVVAYLVEVTQVANFP